MFSLVCRSIISFLKALKFTLQLLCILLQLMSLCRGHTLYSSVSSTRGSQIMHYKSQFVKVGAGVYGFLAPEKRFRLELSKCVTSE